METTKTYISKPIDIAGYKIQRKIGEGGMAVIYLAEQEALGREVALKVMGHNTSSDPQFRERFLKESRIIANLSHPQIVALYDVFLLDTYCAIAMEYVRGGSLKEKIKNGIDPERALLILRQTADALGYAHGRGVIHRDVKPDNILLRDDEDAVLSDFGIAKNIDSNTMMTQAGMCIGTPQYMSPEQLQGEPIGPYSDLYSLGIVFYEMLTGEQPYQGTDGFSIALKQINDPPPTLPSSLRKYQPLLDMMTAKNVNNRVADAEQLIKAIDDLQHKHNSNNNSIKNAVIVSRFSRWAWATAASAMVLLAIAVGLRWYLAPNPVKSSTPSVIIEEMLTQAKYYFNKSQFAKPSGENALELYARVLDLDPHNAIAETGKQATVKQLADLAAAHLQKEEFRECLFLVDEVLNIVGNDAGLLAIRADCNSRIPLPLPSPPSIPTLLAEGDAYFSASQFVTPKGENAYEFYQQVLAVDPQNQQALAGLNAIVEELVKKGDDHFSASQFFRPEGENAYEAYRWVLKIDSKNQRAIDGLKAIASYIADAAWAFYEKGDLSKAKTHTRFGLRIFPHPRLLALQSKMEQQ